MAEVLVGQEALEIYLACQEVCLQRVEEAEIMVAAGESLYLY
jgi:hypothetical protein